MIVRNLHEVTFCKVAGVPEAWRLHPKQPPINSGRFTTACQGVRDALRGPQLMSWF
jgi:hypothetical protein